MVVVIFPCFLFLIILRPPQPSLTDTLLPFVPPFRSSSTWTSSPGGSPLGEASQRPSSSAVAITQNGEARSQSTSRSCSSWRALSRTLGKGSPISSSSEEHTSELQSLMRLLYAVLCLKTTQILSSIKICLSLHTN